MTASIRLHVSIIIAEFAKKVNGFCTQKRKPPEKLGRLIFGALLRAGKTDVSYKEYAAFFTAPRFEITDYDR